MRKRYKILIAIVYCFTVIICDEFDSEKAANLNTALTEDLDDRPLLLATLDGVLAAVEKRSGDVLWKIQDPPLVQVPLDPTKVNCPIFLPDPRDGSLYVIKTRHDPIKKLPFSIPQLVSSSPCKSSDGILYTGSKKDTWYKLDPKTGNKQPILGWDDTSPTCPVETNKFVYIGRSKYDLMMVDTNSPARTWNITFYDYPAAGMTKEEVSRYDLVHFGSTSSGKLLTLDRRTGRLIWDLDLGSPVIGAYIIDSDGLIKVPLTCMANHTIYYLANELETHHGLMENPNRMKLFPTLYIGEHEHGLYAIPSLVDKNVVTISAYEDGPLLLGGPHAPERPRPYPEFPLPGQNYRLPKDMYEDNKVNFQSVPDFNNHVIIYTGHYNVPEYTVQKIYGPNKQQLNLITDESVNKMPSVGVQTEPENVMRDDGEVIEQIRPKNVKQLLKNTYHSMKLWINQQENKGLKLSLIIMTGCVIAMFWYLQIQVREMQKASQNGSASSQISSSMSRNSQITAYSEELPDGMVRVGKITFHPDQLLGKGCEGTFVYRGEFDSRRVAVKRLLPECFTFADREVALLRESDAHPNVVRYYCMEQDRMFRYIALELCQATLSEYVQGKCDTGAIVPLEVLKQATAGLAHLHSLDIVHRDIKPHNVLISVPNNRGEVRAMISDFGLCKKLQVGRVSFSRRSGITGTDGWIAPEMLNGSERTTAAVDLFSLGCLYYYVLSNGGHPFGDTLRRQANILMGEYALTGLKGPDWLKNVQIPLISALISSNPERRPSCAAVLAHPIFWNSTRILAFFQDVSDRVERAETDDLVLKTLENGGKPIVNEDWRVHIHEEVAKDLRKYRTYRGDSVRDLLRALRNKKHHFRELTEEAQETLGNIPDGFTNYWTSRFPLLLVHAWIVMQCVADEDTFRNYYHFSFRYSLGSFKEQVADYIRDNPIVLPVELNLEHFEKKKCEDEGRSLKYFNHNPRRLPRITFLEKQKTPERTCEAIGLYRNLNSSPEKKWQGLDVSEVKLNDNEPENRQSPRKFRKDSFLVKRNKKKKKVDEPLVWNMTDGN